MLSHTSPHYKQQYLDVTVSMLQQAQTVCSVVTDGEDEDMTDYINLLREGILEAYSGIIQGLNDANKVRR
jgi:importin subunit beta-1